MNFFNDVNGITAVFAGIFLVPIAAGILYPSSAGRIRHSFLSFLNNMELIAGIILTLYLYKLIFVERNSGLLNYIGQFVPSMEGAMAQSRHIFTYSVIFLFSSLFIVILAVHLAAAPLYRHVMVPFADRVSAWIDSQNGAAKRFVGALWQLPRSLWLVLVFSLILNFFTYYESENPAAYYINRSAAYTSVNEKVLHPVLDSRIAKKIPVLIRDSFQEINAEFYARNMDKNGQGGGVKPVDSIFPIIEFFNGVTLEEAVKSTKEIDETALKIVGDEKDQKQKAYLLYKWISKNIAYDYDKAEALTSDPSSLKSGAQVAFSERRGICFDYASLYVSMSRAVGLKVRLVTGLGYNGSSWGDHAWNQVYYPKEKRWINVDSTFGSTGHNSFDSVDFTWIHKNDDIQGEW
jgi:transglutaminase-like putative cysteine protease